MTLLDYGWHPSCDEIIRMIVLCPSPPPTGHPMCVRPRPCGAQGGCVAVLHAGAVCVWQ